MNSSPPSAYIMRCPYCAKSIRYDVKNEARPFCSLRCKTQDIAQWASESFRIQAQESSTEELNNDELDQFIAPKFDDDI